jgi:hypothetical protein
VLGHDWATVDVGEYVRHNYGDRLLEEDRNLIDRTVKAFRDTGLAPGSLQSVADIGSGPNLYPAMLWAPYLADGGALHLLEYSSAFRAYTASLVGADAPDPGQVALWRRFERVMADLDGQWDGALDTILATARVEAASVHELPPAAYDAASMFFVAECCTEETETFVRAVRRAVATVRPGGLFVAAHILGSTGMHQHNGGFFPAYPATMDDLHLAYSGTAIAVTRLTWGAESRPGYTGTAFAVGHVG